MATALEAREADLRRSEQRHRLLFQQNPLPLWVYDVETLRFLEVNDAAVRHYGYSRASSSRCGSRTSALRKMSTEWPPTSHSRRRRGPGRPVAAPAQVRRDDRRRNQLDPVRLQRAARPPGARARRDGAGARGGRAAPPGRDRRGLRRRHHRQDARRAIVSWNAGAEKLYGYTAAEAIGRSVSILMPEDRADELTDLLRRLAAGEHLKQYQSERRRKDGSLIPVSLTLSPIRDRNGRIAGASAISARHQTSGLRAEQALRASEERFRRIAETVSEVFWVADMAAQSIVYISPGLRAHLGPHLREPLPGPTLVPRRRASRRSGRRARSARSQQAGQPYECEYRIVRPDGEVRWIWDRGYPGQKRRRPRHRIRGIGAGHHAAGRRRAGARRRRGAHALRARGLACRHLGSGLANRRLVLVRDLRAHAWARAGHVRPAASTHFLETRPPGRPVGRHATRSRTRPATGSLAEVEYRTTWPDGSVHWLNSNGRFFVRPVGRADSWRRRHRRCHRAALARRSAAAGAEDGGGRASSPAASRTTSTTC